MASHGCWASSASAALIRRASMGSSARLAGEGTKAAASRAAAEIRAGAALRRPIERS